MERGETPESVDSDAGSSGGETSTEHVARRGPPLFKHRAPRFPSPPPNGKDPSKATDGGGRCSATTTTTQLSSRARDFSIAALISKDNTARDVAVDDPVGPAGCGCCCCGEEDAAARLKQSQTPVNAPANASPHLIVDDFNNSPQGNFMPIYTFHRHFSVTKITR